MLPALISAGASLLGGLMNKSSAADANAQQMALARENMEMQKDFARRGIRWRVDDAKAAGIHPLYALGAQTTSFSPVSAGTVADTSMGSAVASAGQDLSRAMNATRTNSERDAAFTKTVQDLTLTKAGLENELLASQIAKLKASINPPFPEAGPYPLIPMSGKQEERPPLQIGGTPWMTDAGTTNQQQFADRYGDEGPPSWITSALIGWQDLKRNYPSIAEFEGNISQLDAWLRKHLGPVPFYRLRK